MQISVTRAFCPMYHIHPRNIWRKEQIMKPYFAILPSLLSTYFLSLRCKYSLKYGQSVTYESITQACVTFRQPGSVAVDCKSSIVSFDLLCDVLKLREKLVTWWVSKPRGQTHGRAVLVTELNGPGMLERISPRTRPSTSNRVNWSEGKRYNILNCLISQLRHNRHAAFPV